MTNYYGTIVESVKKLTLKFVQVFFFWNCFINYVSYESYSILRLFICKKIFCTPNTKPIENENCEIMYFINVCDGNVFIIFLFILHFKQFKFLLNPFLSVTFCKVQQVYKTELCRATRAFLKWSIPTLHALAGM